MVSVLLDGVSKSYDETQAVSDLNLRLDSGEAVVLLGPSGSGKTTILRLVAGLDQPSSGDVLFDGQPASDEPDKRNVTMLFDENRLYPKMSARENIGFPLTVRRTPEPERTHRVEAEAGALGIQRLLERMPPTLSAGESNLVHLAKAMVRAPGLFLVDEPLAAIDARARFGVRGILRDIQRGYGVTALYATHDQDDAMTLADRIVVLNGGRVRQTGAPQTVYKEPVDTFVAGFLGTPPMSFFEGEAAPGGVSLGALRLTAPSDLPKKVTVGVRPEHWRRRSAGIEVRVVGISDWGGTVFVKLETGLGDAEMRWSGDPPNLGDQVTVAPDVFHLFDASDGRALFHSSRK